MQRIIVLGIIIFLCSGSSVAAQLNKFNFMAEIAEKIQRPVQTYSELYANFIKEKLRSENPEADDEVLTPLSKMIVTPENKVLIAKGANVISDLDGDTPLIAAAALGKNPEKIKILLKAGARINDKNKAGRTPLIMSAISRRPLEKLKILVENGAKLNIIDNSGCTTAYD